MKRIGWKLLLIGLISGPIAAAEFNGYIVKYRGKLDKSIKLQKDIHTTFGNFALVQNKKTIEQLQKSSQLEYVEPNYIYTLQEWSSGQEIEDRKFKKQWALENTGKNSATWGIFHGEVGEDVNALKAWELTTGSRDIVIAVLDLSSVKVGSA